MELQAVTRSGNRSPKIRESNGDIARGERVSSRWNLDGEAATSRLRTAPIDPRVVSSLEGTSTSNGSAGSPPAHCTCRKVPRGGGSVLPNSWRTPPPKQYPEALLPASIVPVPVLG